MFEMKIEISVINLFFFILATTSIIRSVRLNYDDHNPSFHEDTHRSGCRRWPAGGLSAAARAPSPAPGAPPSGSGGSGDAGPWSASAGVGNVACGRWSESISSWETWRARTMMMMMMKHCGHFISTHLF